MPDPGRVDAPTGRVDDPGAVAVRDHPGKGHLGSQPAATFSWCHRDSLRGTGPAPGPHQDRARGRAGHRRAGPRRPAPAGHTKRRARPIVPVTQHHALAAGPHRTRIVPVPRHRTPGDRRRRAQRDSRAQIWAFLARQGTPARRRAPLIEDQALSGTVGALVPDLVRPGDRLPLHHRLQHRRSHIPRLTIRPESTARTPNPRTCSVSQRRPYPRTGDQATREGLASSLFEMLNSNIYLRLPDDQSNSGGGLGECKG